MGRASGTSCVDPTSRAGVAPLCWQVYPQGIPLTPQVNVDIPVRQILSGAPPFSPLEPDATQAACGQVDLTAISVQFLYFDPANLAAPAATHAVAITVDTVGPPAPSGVVATPVDGRIEATWANVSAGDAALAELVGVNMYCEKADTAVATCSAPHLSAPTASKTVPDASFDATYRCGTVIGSYATVVESSSGNALVDGTKYAVALAGVDNLGNIGPLSTVACATPQAATATPNDDSGCAMLGVSRSPGPLTLGAAFVALAGVVRRRRRSARPRP